MPDPILVDVNQSSTYTINEGGNTYIFLLGSSISTGSSESAVHVTTMAGGTVLRLRGTLANTDNNGVIDVDAENTRIVVEKTASISGQLGISVENVATDIVVNGSVGGSLFGMYLLSSVGSVVNNGQISGGATNGYAVIQSAASGAFHFENNGVLSGYGALVLEASEVTVMLGKTSRIHSITGIQVNSQSGDTANVVNHGLMSHASAHAYSGGAGEDTFINRGTIAGDILLGGGDDRFIDKGEFEGDVSGGAGDDLFVLKKATTIDENIGGGTDSARIGVSFALPEEVENLRLTGGRNAKALGNTDPNTIIGNSGNNLIWGLEGTDTLTGGGGRDVFLYIKFNADDTITDFKHGQDRIRIEGFTEFTDFGDLDFIKSGNDVRISFADENGTDFIIVEKQKIGDFDKGDFLFG